MPKNLSAKTSERTKSKTCYVYILRNGIARAYRISSSQVGIDIVFWFKVGAVNTHDEDDATTAAAADDDDARSHTGGI